MEELRGVHYDAFISYRHSELDAYVAENIQRRLERFRLPKSVRAKVKNGKTKIERVFRDVDELPLSDNLSDPINNALANSDFLITICTPRYLESRWCMKEIDEFLKTHDREHVLVVLAEDEPCNSFPEILTYEELIQTDEEGNTIVTRREIEPLAADTRGSNRKEISKAIDIAVIKLCAEIFGLNYDDLRRRQRRQKIQRMILVFSTIGAALLMFAIFATITLIKLKNLNDTITSQYEDLQEKNATIAFQNSELEENNRTITEQNTELEKNNRTISSQYNELQEKSATITAQNEELEQNNKLISEQYAELQDRYASSMAITSEKLLGAGRKKDALYVLSGVLKDVEPENYNSDALRSLYSVMNTYNVDNRYYPEVVFEDVQVESISFDGKYLLAYCASNLSYKIYDIETGNLIKNLGTDIYDIGFCGSKGVLYNRFGDLCYETIGGNDVRIYDTDEICLDFDVSIFEADDGQVSLLVSENIVNGFDNDGNIIFAIDLCDHFSESLEKNDDEFFFDEPSFSVQDVCFDDGKVLMGLYNNDSYYLMIFDELSGEVYSDLYEKSAVSVRVLMADGIIYYTLSFEIPYGTGVLTTLVARDAETGEVIYSRKYQDLFVEDIVLFNDNLFTYGDFLVVVFDRATGDVENMYNTIGNVIYGWVMDDSFCFILNDGSVYKCYIYLADDGLGMKESFIMRNYTDGFFSTIPSANREITFAKFVNDDLFYLFDDSYLVRYSEVKNPNAEKTLDEYDRNNYCDLEFSIDPSASSIFGEGLMMDAYYSDDRKLIVAIYDNDQYKLFDAESKEEVASFETEATTSKGQKYINMYYSETTGGYIMNERMNAYIFNDKYQIVNITGQIADEKDGKLIILSDNEISYSIPYIGPEELVKMSVDELEGYKPSEAIMMKYNIGSYGK